MSPDAEPVPPRLRHSGFAVAALFFVNGATFSNWLPRIPEIRDHLGIGNAGLGATLLGGGLGGLIGTLTVSRVMDRWGSRRVLLTAAGLLSVGMPLIAWVPVAPLLLLVLTVLGTLDVCNDIGMNAQGVIVQTRLGRSIMNRLHAMWSLGFTSGALLGSAASAVEINVRLHLAVVGAALLATVVFVQRWLIRTDPPPEPHDDPAADGKPARRFSPVVLSMAIAAMAAIALEITPNDWAAVLMRDVFDAGRYSGFGTLACAGAMLIGRLGGDHVLDRVGTRRLMVGAMWLIGVGLAITAAAPVAIVALAGLFIWGLGLSVVFPQLYASAARLPGTTAGAGLGAMLFGQRLGAMLTAVVVGAIGGWLDLRWAFAIVGGLAFATIVAVSNNRQAVASA
jgi:predicted MFS family arabinose efflux permease